MKRVLLSSAILLALLPFAGEQEGLAQKKKEGKAKGAVKASPPEYVKIQNQKEVIGQLGFADNEAVSIRIEFQHLEPNPAFKPGGIGGKGGTNLARLYQEIQRDQADIARARNAVERQRRMMELQRDMQRLQIELAKAQGKAAGKGGGPAPFKTVSETKEFDLDVADKLVVRWANPPFQYDDKGDVKTYTKEELAKMRGNDPKLPGYEAKMDDLAPGQKVKLSLLPPGKKDKDDPDADTVARPRVAMVVILEESNLPYTIPKGKGKKK